MADPGGEQSSGATVLITAAAAAAAPGLIEALRGDASAVVIESLDELCQRITEPGAGPGAVVSPEAVGAVVVTGESLAGGRASQLRAALDEQPAWSSVPVLVLVQGADAPEAAAALSHATLLPRSTPVVSLVSVIRAALRDRDRQYQIRDYLRALSQMNERKDMLLGELAHRVKNTLTVIQAIVTETRRQCSDMDTFVEALEGRLRALAVSHDVLQTTRWQGGDLDQVITSVMSPFLGSGGVSEPRLLRQGPPVTLRPEATQAMSMILHELASNAAKYGALSTETGAVVARWGMGASGELRFEWREEGGPPARPPERRGYGTSLIEQLAPYQFGGASRLLFEPGGVRCEISLPPKNLVGPAAS